MQYKGEFQVTDWQETTDVENADGTKLNKAAVTQSYQGTLQGDSKVFYYMHYNNNGTAFFNGFEFFQGSVDGNAVQMTFKHQGRFEEGKAKSSYEVINSSDASLIGKSGGFEAGEGGKADYWLD